MERSKSELIGALKQKEAEKYPLFQKLQTIANTMKKLWSENAWILLDKEAMAVLEDIRKDHEARAAEMEHLVGKERMEAHQQIDARFDAVHDKKLLRLQLHSMNKEHDAIVKFVELRNGQRK